MLICFFVFCCVGGGVFVYQGKALKRNVESAELIYRSIRPNYNLNVSDRSYFAKWEKDAYPSSGTFSSSTEYIRNLVSNKWIQPYFGLFALPGVTPYRGEDSAKFSSNNNAWVMTLDIDPKKLPRVPFMFTRNLDIRCLSEAHPKRLRDVAPFGKRGILVVMTDGSARFIRAEDIEKEFNPLGLTNDVLRP